MHTPSDPATLVSSQHIHTVERLNLGKLVGRRTASTICHALIVYPDLQNTSISSVSSALFAPETWFAQKTQSSLVDQASVV